jgi:hypothetical protein
MGLPWRLAFALQDDGWYLRRDIIWHKPNPMPESATDRPSTAHEYVFLLTKQPRYFYDADAVRTITGKEALPENYGGKGLITHPTGPERKAVDLGSGMSQTKVMPNATHPAGAALRSVWKIATQAFSGPHYATYPEKLVEPCIMAGTSEAGECPECGAPWERVVETEHKIHKNWFGDKQSVRHARGNAGNSYKEIVGRHTTGWQQSCEHAISICVPCRTVLVSGDERQEQIPSYVRTLWEKLSGEEQGESVLRARLPGQVHDGHQENDKGVGSHSEGLHSSVPSEAPDVSAQRLRDGTQARDGGTSGKEPASRRDSSPQERSQRRQSPRKPRTDGQERTRPEAEEKGSSVSVLWASVPHGPSCPSCDQELHTEALPPVPQLVLDCFSGAGTTGLVAARFDRNYIGIELNPEYAEMSRKRIADRVGVTDPDELDPGEQAQGRMF